MSRAYLGKVLSNDVLQGSLEKFRFLFGNSNNVALFCFNENHSDFSTSGNSRLQAVELLSLFYQFLLNVMFG